MTCTELAERLDDLVDGRLNEDEARAVGAHLLGCAACRAEEESLREILAAAKQLGSGLRPARDLWPEVSTRIENEDAGAQVRHGFRMPWLWATAAAVALVSGALVLRLTQGPGHAVGGRIDRLPVAQVEDAGLEQAEADYAHATAALLAAIEGRRDRLPPETVARVRQNLGTIDAALLEVRGALRENPRNPELLRLLASTSRRKVDLLQRVVRLSS
jgi:anti-sigma factor RsiW